MAAGHLRAASADLRSRASGLGQVGARRQPRTWTPADLARSESAKPPLAGHPEPVQPHPADPAHVAPRPRRAVRPPPRAGPHR
jgi:hypothetical protein